MQLIVLGMHRSGTSVLARVLNLMGVYFGPEGISTGANQENPKGFWERRDVRALNDGVLHAVGCDWNRVLHFDPTALPQQVLNEFNKKAAKLVLELDGNRPWLLKEPRLCLLLPLWRRFLEVPVGIHIYRNPVEVASSLHKRNGIPILAGLGLWERYVRSALDASEGIPRIVVLHRQLMEAPVEAIGQLLQQLACEGVPGLRMPTEREIAAFVRNELYRERESRDDLRVYDKTPQLALFKTLRAGRLPAAENKKSGAHYKALEEYEAGLAPLDPPSSEANVTEAVEASLRGQLSLREQEVKLVREFYGKYETDLKRHDAWLAQMDGMSERLEQQHQKRIAALEQSIRARDERIKVLEAAHQEDRKSIGAHEAGIRARDERIKVLEAAHLEDREVVHQLESVIRARDESIKRLEQANNDNQHQVAAVAEGKERAMVLNSQIEAMKDELGGLRAQLSTRDAAMRELREMLGDREQESALAIAAKLKVERTLDTRYKEIGQLSELLIESRQQLTRITTGLEASEYRAEQHRQMLRQIENELASIKRGRSWRMISKIQAMSGRLRLSKSPAALLSNDISLLRDSGLFDATWYLQRYVDVADSGMDPIEHFLRFGAAELRSPGPGFETAAYLKNNPDVAESGINPLLHYINNGKSEGRNPK